jgi:translation initiation factor IF-2
MKTLTELSGSTLRKAAAAIAEAKRSLPREEAPVVAEVAAPVAPPEAAAAPAGGDTAPAEGDAAPAAPAVEASPPAPAPAARPAEETESEAVKVALDEAVAAATGLTGDRLARLRDAVKVVGRQIEDVRLVRVFGPEEPVSSAKTVNGFQYLVDVAPASMRQAPTMHKKERGRGGPGGPGGGGGGGGRGGGGGGKGAPTSGGFSMDSLRDDRKGQKSGPGGGRGRPGGGKPGGGKPGGGAPR